jgi:sterol desaturase/sphingolipid hydroxylase (fatty acid hydroxylase superfamily)
MEGWNGKTHPGIRGRRAGRSGDRQHLPRLLGMLGRRCHPTPSNSARSARASTYSIHDGQLAAIMYFGEMLVASLLAAILVMMSQPFRSSATALFGTGIIAWTLAEYIVHRFVLHRLAPKEHRLHHASPHGAILTIFWQIWVCFALVYLVAGAAFLAGALVAYAWYLFVHYCAHHGPDIVPSRLLRHHRTHHQFATRNYGVSTTLWDHVFGTVLK